MSADGPIVFRWAASSYFGWGIYGLNLMLHWPRPALSALPTDRIVLAREDQLRRVEELVRASEKFHERLKPFANRPGNGAHIHFSLQTPDGKFRARFLRSNENEAMLIQFNQRPDPQFLDMLREEGLRWEPRAHSDFAKGAWIMDLQPGQEWRNHSRTEQAFIKVVNAIREANGLEEFVGMAGRG